MNIFQPILNYGKMVKFSHTIFALPFAGLASVMALVSSALTPQELYWKLFWIFICMFSARSAAMGFNRYIDREFDKQNPRTAGREIPAGVISEKSAISFIVLFSVSFLIGSYFLNFLCFLLAFPALAIILFYSLSKRFTIFCHFILGLGIGIAPTGAWLAIQGVFSPLPFLWSFGLMFHIAGFDILYSMQDIEIDKKLGLHSIPSKFGVSKSLVIARLSHVLSFLLLISAGIYGGLGIFYYIFLAITGILFIIEHRMVSPDDLSKIPIAFFHINASISVILFIGIFIDKWNELLIKFAGSP